MSSREPEVPAAAELAAAGVPFAMHKAPSEQDAVLGLAHGNERRVFLCELRTLDGSSTYALLPRGSELDERAMANAAGAQSSGPAKELTLQRVHETQSGPLSVFGSGGRVPVLLDVSAMNHKTVLLASGAPGVLVELTPSDLIRAMRARLAPIARR